VSKEKGALEDVLTKMENHPSDDVEQEASSGFFSKIGKGLSKGFSKGKDAVKGGLKATGSALKTGGRAAGRFANKAGSAITKGAKDFAAGAKNTFSAAGDAMKAGAIKGGLLGAAVPAVGGGIAGAKLGKKLGGEKGEKIGAGVGGGVLGLGPALVGALAGAISGPAIMAVDKLRTDEKKILAKTADIPGFHVILEQLAHNYAYGRGDSATLEQWGYKVSSEHEDPNSGFRVVAFSPIDPIAKDPDGNTLKPVVAFRGTCNEGGALDDANERGIGTFQFSRNTKEIKAVIKSAKGKGAPVVTGHSLGGALAQLAVARFGGMVGDVVTFQAPGIDSAEADKVDPQKHKSTHYRAEGDLVSDAGEAHTGGEIIKFGHQGPQSGLTHLAFPLAELNSLRQKHKPEDTPVVEGARTHKDHWVKPEEKQNVHQVVDTKVARNEVHEQTEKSLNANKQEAGKWADKDVQHGSRLLSVGRYKDNKEAGTTSITTMAGLGRGRGLAEGVRKKAGTWLAKRQNGYAVSWDKMEPKMKQLKDPKDLPALRKEAVSVLKENRVDPKDHGKFVSHLEAFALESLKKHNGEAKKDEV